MSDTYSHITRLNVVESLVVGTSSYSGSAQVPVYSFPQYQNYGFWVGPTGNLNVSVEGSIVASFTPSGTHFVVGTPNSPNVRFIRPSATVANYIDLGGNSTGGAPAVSFTGTDTQVVGLFRTRGALGSFLFRNNYGGTEGTLLRIAPVASAENYLNLEAATSTQNVRIGVSGASGAIGLDIRSKDRSEINLATFVSADSTAFNMLRVVASATATQYINIEANNSAPIISVSGAVDADLRLQAKGVGTIRFGTYTAGTTAATGWITIKEDNGTVRRLLCV